MDALANLGDFGFTFGEEVVVKKKKKKRGSKYPIRPRRGLDWSTLTPSQRYDKVKDWFTRKEKQVKKMIVQEELQEEKERLQRELSVKERRESFMKAREARFKMLRRMRKRFKYRKVKPVKRDRATVHKKCIHLRSLRQAEEDSKKKKGKNAGKPGPAPKPKKKVYTDSCW